MECKFCSTEFTPKNRIHVFCSDSCRGQHRNLSRDQSSSQESKKNWYKNNPSCNADYQLRAKYGITLQQFEELLAKQNNKCFICLKDQSEESRRFAVDHDHITGEIRGILCGFCNRRLIGRHRDADKFERAAMYLRQGTGLFVPPKKKKNTRNKRNRLSASGSVRRSPRRK